MPTYGPWVQLPEHELDYKAAFDAGHGADPQSFDPQFGGDNAWGDGSDFIAYRARGIGQYNCYQPSTPTLAYDTTVTIAPYGYSYVEPSGTAAKSALQAAWDAAVVSTAPFTPAPGRVNSFLQGEPTRYETVASSSDYQIYVITQARLFTFRAGGLELWRPNPPGAVPLGASYVQWEGPATVLSAAIYLKPQFTATQGYYDGPDDHTVDVSTSGSKVDHALTGASMYLRACPSATSYSSGVGGLNPDPAIAMTPAGALSLPLITELSSSSDWVRLDVTDFLTDVSGSPGVSVLAHTSMVVNGPQIPSGFGVRHSYHFDASIFDDGTGSFGIFVPLTNSGYTPDHESGAPYIAWTILPARYRWVYPDPPIQLASARWDNARLNLVGALSDTRTRFAPRPVI